MSKLDPELFRQIRSLCEHAGNLVQMGEDEFALSKYYEALTLVPDPKSDHSISTFIYTAIGEQYFRMKDYGEAGKCFFKAYNCPGGEEIGQINFRVGQCLEECGERKKAQDFLCQAYLLGGEELFVGANPKYYKIIRSEVEGTLPEDDELDLLREADEYDIIDDILRSGGSKESGDYSGYTGESSDRDIDIYSRSRSGQSAGGQRTSRQTEDDWDYDSGEEDYDDYDDALAGLSDDYDDYDDYDEDGEEDEERAPRSGSGKKRSGDAGNKEPGAWSKIVAGIKKFVDLFK